MCLDRIIWSHRQFFNAPLKYFFLKQENAANGHHGNSKELLTSEKDEAFCGRFAPIISRIVGFAKAVEGFEDIPHEDQVSR